SFFFFFNDTATTEIYTLSLHDALPICHPEPAPRSHAVPGLRAQGAGQRIPRSKEHTSELQSHSDLVCRLLLDKKKKSMGSLISKAERESDRRLTLKVCAQ